MTQQSGLLSKGVPPFPQFLLFLKGAIILLSIVVLALAAYDISLYGGYGYYYYSTGVPGYLIFLAIKTWIVYGVATAIELSAPQFFYRPIILVAYILSIIFWLSGWAWSASSAAAWLSLFSGSYYRAYTTYGAVLAACAGIGALIWILCIVNLVFFVKTCLANPGEATGGLELGSQKQSQSQTQTTTTTVYPQGYTQPQPQAYPQQAYPQQAYPQQPVVYQQAPVQGYAQPQQYPTQ